MRRALFVYCCLLCLPSLRADDLTALTDTNGFFTWPTNLQASQVTGYTNLPFLGYNTTNNAGWTLTPNGHYTFIDNYGTTNSFTASGWEIYQTNGASLIYTNGVLALDGTNVANVAQLADDYASLSNFTFTEFGTLGANDTNNAAAASNNLAALAYTLAAAGTNNTQAASNTLAALAWQIGANDTNYAVGVAQNAQTFALTLGADLTNYVNSQSVTITNLLDLGNATTNNLNATSNDLQTALGNLGNDTTNNTMAASNSLAALLTTGGLSYRSGNNIVLQTADLTTRFEADQGGITALYLSSGGNLLYNDGYSTYLYDGSGVNRLECDYQSSTILRGGNGQNGLTVSANGYIAALNPVTANTGAWPLVAGGMVTNFFADAGNSGTTETHVNAFTVPANSMITNGDTLVRTIGISIASGTSDKEIKVYFGGNTIFDSGALANSAAGAYSIRAEVIAVNSTQFRYNVMATATSITPSAFATVGQATLASGDFTGTQDFDVSLTASGTGAGSSQATVITDTTIFDPASSRGSAQ